MTIRFPQNVSKAILISGLSLMVLTPACSPSVAPVLEPEPEVAPSVPFVIDGVRQDEYSYSHPEKKPVVIPQHDTFVMKAQPSFLGRPEGHPFPVAFFDLGSSSLTYEASNKLLRDLQECCLSCPLYLTGYTCSLGKEGQNQKLSRQRAEAVAALLRKNGYKVVSVEGKGMVYGSNPASHRKVEIRLSRQ
jgi:outer membrane protein OmpA-like peptidoglycan-associated protein